MKNGIVLLEVYTINGIYNVLYDGNQRNNKVAYYISGNYATFQNGKNKLDAYDAGEYFVISNATLVTETEDVDLTVTFNELIKICMQNGWEIDYTYKM
jgi:site-specific DNA recombinase